MVPAGHESYKSGTTAPFAHETTYSSHDTFLSTCCGHIALSTVKTGTPMGPNICIRIVASLTHGT